MARSQRAYVDYRVTVAYVGTVLKYIGVTPAFPLVLALYYGEDPVPFVATSVVMIGSGALLERVRGDGDLGNREAFLLVSLAWLVVPLLGTVPYLVAGTGTVATPVNAMFESMSGFTTTGATVLGEISVERHGHAMLLWRQLTQWLGGMGILVLMIAILPELSVGGAQVINQEAPGLALEKLTPRIQETARVLWSIYAGVTVLTAAVYYGLHLAGTAPNMDLYNAVAHALTTMPTGGFSPEARSAEAFAPAAQWVMMPFMLVAGTNFALFWYVLKGKPNRLTGNTEFRSYLLAVAGFGAVISAVLYLGVGLAEMPSNVAVIPGNVESALRQGLFQVIAIVTTTGYASMDVNAWDGSAQTILLFAYFLGGSAGSAAGSVKIVRWVLVKRAIGRSLYTSVHPQAIRPLRLEGEAVDEETIRDVFVFVLLFLALFAFSTVVLYLDSFRTPEISLSGLDAMSVAIATLGNVGPGFGVVGPMNSFLPFSDAAKLYMIFLMWIGRLEVLSVLVIFTPSFWRW
ncbi:TrkH family potassium uptake protein [Haloplanus aerogenes]|uniref:Trk system potassium uptake protein TrkH n=1 Tax=Haloplanus aerogenes TaxID=660522 RepID=A0A3M0DEY9_9EURY|nr:TrkH family potassium uptake protein [Haloplanus aerogenes]AZH24915.1 TrkH family potassium uptake protein [Haloplanus aerogenes]RMB13873.1 trk system potassium uptake protein TrkH [Haloplanus aerogenes]